MAGRKQAEKRAWTLVPQGDRTLLLVFGDEIDVGTGRACTAAAATLRAARLSGVTDIVPTFNSVALHIDPRLLQAGTDIPALTNRLQTVLDDALTPATTTVTAREVDIPVCYGGDFGPDLNHVAEHCGLEPDEVIHLHSHQPAYVFMLGFAPGAPYIGVHDERLAIGRRATPRTVLPAGSVAIANRQTMIYPNASPGGWHIIGATPAVLFNPEQDPPTLLSPGDTVNFVPISAEVFVELQRKSA